MGFKEQVLAMDAERKQLEQERMHRRAAAFATKAMDKFSENFSYGEHDDLRVDRAEPVTEDLTALYVDDLKFRAHRGPRYSVHYELITTCPKCGSTAFTSTLYTFKHLAQALQGELIKCDCDEKDTVQPSADLVEIIAEALIERGYIHP